MKQCRVAKKLSNSFSYSENNRNHWRKLQLIKIWIIATSLAPDMAHAALRKSKSAVHHFVSRARTGAMMVSAEYLDCRQFRVSDLRKSSRKSSRKSQLFWMVFRKILILMFRAE